MSTEGLILTLVMVGLGSGLLGGMLGIGGGVVIVPALIILLEFSGQFSFADITIIAVATSMACIVFTSMSAAYTQYRAGMVRWDIFRRLAPFFVGGSFLAGILAPLVPTLTLRLIIGVFLFGVAAVMLTNWKPSTHRPFPGLFGSACTGLGGGLMSGIAGIAGGNIIVPTLIYLNTPVHRATATSSAMGVPIALAGAISYALGTASAEPGAMLGYIHLPSWLIITVGAIVGAPVGVRLAHRIPAQTLKRCFAVLLILAAGRMIYVAMS